MRLARPPPGSHPAVVYAEALLRSSGDAPTPAEQASGAVPYLLFAESPVTAFAFLLFARQWRALMARRVAAPPSCPYRSLFSTN